MQKEMISRVFLYNISLFSYDCCILEKTKLEKICLLLKRSANTKLRSISAKSAADVTVTRVDRAVIA